MGRPMRPVDPADGPLQQFAAGLRDLREQAGNPTFRQLARRAHYSATTLSVACSGTILPSLDVVLAFVRACDGPEDAWQQRWHEVAASGRTANGAASSPAAHQRPAARARSTLAQPPASWLSSARLVLPFAVVSIASVALTLGATWVSGAFDRGPARPLGLPAGYIGISRCDPGSYPVFSQQVTLPHSATVGSRVFPAGTVVGVISLRYSPRCSEAWPHFSPAPAFFGKSGQLTLISRSTPDNAVSMSHQYSHLTFADGEPMLTVQGCVDAEARVGVGQAGPPVTTATHCFQRS